MERIITPKELQKLANTKEVSKVIEVTIKRRYVIPKGVEGVMDWFYAGDLNKENLQRDACKMPDSDEIVNVKVYMNKEEKLNGQDKDSALIKINKEIKGKVNSL